MRNTGGPLIVSILSGKGGVGKSVLALNLAERCAHLGLRSLAIDLCQAGGNLHLLANCANRIGIEQYLNAAVGLEQVVTNFAPHCDLMCRTESGSIRAFEDSSSLLHFCDNLRDHASKYDVIIIDHGSGMSSVSTTTSRQSDLSLLVVVPELTSIADCYGLFKFLTEQDRTADCRLVINRVKSESDASYLAEKLTAMAEAFLHVSPKLAGWISEDRSVSESVSKQRPISALQGQSIVIEQVGRVARLLKNENLGRTGRIERAVPGAPVTSQTTINNNPATADIKG